MAKNSPASLPAAPDRPALRFLFGQFVPKCAHQIDKHFDYCVIQFLDGGAVDLKVGPQEYHMKGRWFWSSFPGPKISFRPAATHRTWVHRYLAFQGPAVARWTAQGLWPLAPQPVLAPTSSTDSDYARRFDELLELSRRSDRWGHARAVLLLETILTELAESRSRPRDVPAWLEAAMTRMQSLGATVDHESLAVESGMPARTFRRRFTAAVGMPPHEYLIRCRIGHAREMLGNTDIPIKQIAEQLGYADVSFFTRQFREVAGGAAVGVSEEQGSLRGNPNSETRNPNQ